MVGTKGSKSYTLDDSKSMPAGKGYWGMKSSTGRITPPVVTKGVLFDDLFADVGGLPDDMAIGIVAKDGYAMTMSVEQPRTGEFITYDMVTGEEKEGGGPHRARRIRIRRQGIRSYERRSFASWRIVSPSRTSDRRPLGREVGQQTEAQGY